MVIIAPTVCNFLYIFIAFFVYVANVLCLNTTQKDVQQFNNSISLHSGFQRTETGQNTSQPKNRTNINRHHHHSQGHYEWSPSPSPPAILSKTRRLSPSVGSLPLQSYEYIILLSILYFDGTTNDIDFRSNAAIIGTMFKVSDVPESNQNSGSMNHTTDVCLGNSSVGCNSNCNSVSDPSKIEYNSVSLQTFTHSNQDTSQSAQIKKEIYDIYNGSINPVRGLWPPMSDNNIVSHPDFVSFNSTWQNVHANSDNFQTMISIIPNASIYSYNQFTPVQSATYLPLTYL